MPPDQIATLSSLSHWIEIISMPVLSALFLGLILWLFKIPRTFQMNTESINAFNKSLEHLTASVNRLVNSCDRLEERMDVTDRVLSDVIGEPYDSNTVSSDGSKYPKIKKTRART